MDIYFISVASACLEIFAFCQGPGVFGNVEFVLRRDGYFTYLSDAAQEATYSWLYTLAYLTLSVSNMAIGFILDRYGIWTARSVTQTMIVTGLVCLTAMSPERDWLVWLGIPLFMGTAGITYLCNMPLVTYYSSRKGLLMSVWQASQGFIFLFYIGYKAMENQNWYWALFLILQPLYTLRTFLLTPRYAATVGEPLGWKSRGINQLDSNKKSGDTDQPTSKLQSLKTFAGYALSFKMILMYVWFICGDIRFQAFTSELQPWLRWATEEMYDNSTEAQDARTEEILFYTDIYNYSILLGVAVSLIAGIVVDRLIRMTKQRYEISQNLATARVQVGVMIYISITSILMSLFETVQSVGWNTYVVMLLTVLVRSSLYVTRNLYIYAVVPPAFQGRVLGTASCLQIVSALSQPLLTEIAVNVFDGNYGRLSLALAGLSVVSLIGPVWAGWIFFRTSEDPCYEKSEEKQPEPEERSRAKTMMSVMSFHQ